MPCRDFGIAAEDFFFPFNLHKQAIIDSLFPKVREGDSLQSSYKNFIPSPSTNLIARATSGKLLQNYEHRTKIFIFVTF